jgi:hypothetical protein
VEDGGAGLTDRQAAEVLGVSHTTVQRDRKDGTDVPDEPGAQACDDGMAGTNVPAPDDEDDEPDDDDDEPEPARKPHVSHNSGDTEWYSPLDSVAAAREVLGVHRDTVRVDAQHAGNPAAPIVSQPKQRDRCNISTRNPISAARTLRRHFRGAALSVALLSFLLGVWLGLARA